LDPATIAASGSGGRLLKEDVLRHLEHVAGAAAKPERASAAVAPSAAPEPAPRRAPAPPEPETPPATSADERVVPMSRIRQRIAERLVRAQHTAAILTTFNEIDMSAVIDLRRRHGEPFEKRHGVKLGFMSFFARASVLALEEIPEI